MHRSKTGRFACACPLLCAVTTLALAAQEPEQYRIDSAATSITLKVGRSGIFGFAGHNHEIAVPAVEGRIALDQTDLSRSSLSLEFDAAALRVTGKGEPPDDVAEVQRVMMSEKVLDVRRYPTITFQSRSVTVVERNADRMALRVDGPLTLHGLTRPIVVPVTVRLTADGLIAEGTMSVRQTDFGITPVTAGAGTVRVKDQVGVIFNVTARRR